MKSQIKRTIAILLAVCFLVSLTAAAVSAFSASPTSGKAPLTVSFTDKSTGSPTSWKWSFGDGTYSTANKRIFGSVEIF